MAARRKDLIGLRLGAQRIAESVFEWSMSELRQIQGTYASKSGSGRATQKKRKKFHETKTFTFMNKDFIDQVERDLKPIERKDFANEFAGSSSDSEDLDEADAARIGSNAPRTVKFVRENPTEFWKRCYIYSNYKECSVNGMIFNYDPDAPRFVPHKVRFNSIVPHEEALVKVQSWIEEQKILFRYSERNADGRLPEEQAEIDAAVAAATGAEGQAHAENSSAFS